MKSKTVFLSHSSKDIEKVRKIRNILEVLDYEPLLFCLKCLDDNNETLEDFIKREIEARNIFVYCKSLNSEKSIWVQKELEYIRQSKAKRLYEIDIEKPLSQTLVNLLHTLADIIKVNQVFISCSHMDKDYRQITKDLLLRHGYDVITYDVYDDEKYYNHDNDINIIAKNGIFMPIITSNFLNSVCCKSEIEKILYYHEGGTKVIIKPICINVSSKLIKRLLPSSINSFNFLEIRSEDFYNKRIIENKVMDFLIYE